VASGPPISGSRDYTGPAQQPRMDSGVLIPDPSRVFRPGEGPDPARTYHDDGRLYDGGFGATTNAQPPWARRPQAPGGNTAARDDRPNGTSRPEAADRQRAETAAQRPRQWRRNLRAGPPSGPARTDH
jgi:hypothetical protein